MKNRIQFIDTAKGIGIILMVLGHIGLGSQVYSSIYSFHMPLFFFISGLLFSTPDKKKLIKRCKAILIPYFSLGLIYLAISWVVSGFDIDKLYHLFWDNSCGLPIESALWFLTAFLACQLVYSLLDHFIKNHYYLLMLSCTIAMISCIITKLFGIILPFSIQAGMVGLLYFSVGRFLSVCGFYNNKTTVKSAIFLIAIPTLLVAAAFLPLHNMRTGTYGIIPITEIIALILSICVVYFAKTIPNAIQKPISHYGRNSIVYLGINHATILSIKYLLANQTIIGNPIILKACQIVLCFALLYIATIIINKTPIRKIFGKP